MKLKLTIVTPEKAVASEEVDEVAIPGIQGEFGVLPEHTTFLTALGQGTLTYKKQNSSKSFQIAGGFCEVRENQVTVFVDSVEG
ncbi:MAG: ATP synthase F1 subunit epsilon [Deltaproteobacteria bacterium]|nr:ATP synthase F1 subunit epsilon [Deltaproteobacteria bacterium]MBI4374343.1 ATP synthase F1 subunit epsilon [Deltaproteobacteria bacterium]